MSIYDQNHNTIQQQLTPPDKRSITMLAWERCLVKPIQWIHDLFFIDYAQGNTSSQYSSITSYNIGDRVQYNHKVFEAEVPTVGNAPSPTLLNYGDSDGIWVLVSKDFRGANERVLYSSQVLVFEYLLNQWFATTFRQPNFSSPANSDIWIENTKIVDGSFVMRPNGGAISFMRPNGHNSNYMRPNHSFATVNFIVHYPIAVIPDNSDQLNQLKTLVERYKLAGTVAGYQSY